MLRPLPKDVFPDGAPACRAWMVVLPRWMRLLPSGGYEATTIGRYVFLGRHDPEPGLLAHESVHVWQWARDGIFGFAWRYLSDYVRGRRRGLDHDAAYRAISYEQEAVALSGFG